MRIAALVPTRGRPDTAARAVRTFLAALARSAVEARVDLAVVDDSDDVLHHASLRSLMHDVAAGHREANVVVVPGRREGRQLRHAGGPGAARNRGLAELRRSTPRADVTVMFDDDVCFADTIYRNASLVCDGAKLVASALSVCRDGPWVAGCSYIGRQDLSILEHARNAPGADTTPLHVAPSLDRGQVESVAPGGISTAFLAIGTSPTELPDCQPARDLDPRSASKHCRPIHIPDFPGHYNEDYVWLHALDQAGWPLRRVPLPLIHAPPGDVAVTAEGLRFQIYGEIVWLAVLERDRFPVDDPVSMCASVTEIAGDLHNALGDPAVSGRPEIAHIIREVLAWCNAVGRQFIDGRLGPDARQLKTDIRAGIALRPGETR